jgi:hypothetical protein
MRGGRLLGWCTHYPRCSAARPSWQQAHRSQCSDRCPSNSGLRYFPIPGSDAHRVVDPLAVSTSLVRPPSQPSSSLPSAVRAPPQSLARFTQILDLFHGLSQRLESAHAYAIGRWRAKNRGRPPRTTSPWDRHTRGPGIVPSPTCSRVLPDEERLGCTLRPRGRPPFHQNADWTSLTSLTNHAAHHIPEP